MLVQAHGTNCTTTVVLSLLWFIEYDHDHNSTMLNIWVSTLIALELWVSFNQLELAKLLIRSRVESGEGWVSMVSPTLTISPPPHSNIEHFNNALRQKFRQCQKVVSIQRIIQFPGKKPLLSLFLLISWGMTSFIKLIWNSSPHLIHVCNLTSWVSKGIWYFWLLSL